MKKLKVFKFEKQTERFYGRELDENECVYKLERKGCDIRNKEIDIAYSRQLGNGSWGMISFLCRFIGYECLDSDFDNKFKRAERYKNE